MQYECKITVLDTKVFPELQEKYIADPKSGKCPFFNVGDTFVLKRTAQQDDWTLELSHNSRRLFSSRFQQQGAFCGDNLPCAGGVSLTYLARWCMILVK